MRQIECGFAVDQGGVEHRDGDVGLAQKHTDFGASEDQSIGTLRDQAGGDGFKRGAAGSGGDVAAQLGLDDAVNGAAILGIGDDRGQSCGVEFVVEAFLHGEGGGHQAGALEPGTGDAGGGGLGDVQQGNGDAVYHLIGDFVHGVGGQQQDFGTAALQGLCICVEDINCGVPIAAGLQGSNRGEIYRADQQFWRVQATKARPVRSQSVR